MCPTRDACPFLVAEVELDAELHQLQELEDNWDGYGAERPNGKAIYRAHEFLEALSKRNLPPTKIVPSGRGGVGICFDYNGKFVDLHCSNSGERIVLTSDKKGHIDVFKVATGEVDGAIDRIGQFLSS